jgi:hypothetical protein
MSCIIIINELMVKKRCVCCNKKVGVLGFPCRCVNEKNEPNIYCASCRVPRTKPSDTSGHNCNFDYKQMGRELLMKNNPLIQTVKVESI